MLHIISTISIKIYLYTILTAFYCNVFAAKGVGNAFYGTTEMHYRVQVGRRISVALFS
jgi:hypothetical protein